MTDAIVCKELTKRYGKQRGIEGIDLRVAAGEAFGFLGPNGSGKSTTIRTLMGFQRPTSGHARVFGHDCWEQAVAVKHDVGNLPGDFVYDEQMTGWEVVRHVARLRRHADLEHAHELAERLRADMDRPLRHLSRGNHQKVGLVQAMFHRPKLLLLDEPTSGLDPLMQETFLDMVGEAQAAGATIFLSSHNLEEVHRVCKRVGIIREGRLIATEEIGELIARALRHVRIVFAAPVDPARYRALEGVQDVTAQDATLTLRLSGAVDPLVKLAAQHEVVDLEIGRASLEEVFLAYYGHAEDPAA
ncbi:MAG: ABC transporter ATP-binding protein [Solirubrobacteraceae bacterium]|nr:ABC transporter ATP-binding protein [Solirubrobacteraceae bacterium]